MQQIRDKLVTEGQTESQKDERTDKLFSKILIISRLVFFFSELI